MTQKFAIGPVNKGLKLDRIPPYIDNDSFPTLINAYQWRGRIKRKRGTSALTRFDNQIFSNITALGYIRGPIGTTDGAGNFSGNLVTIFGLEPNSQIAPGTIKITDQVNTYIEPVKPDGNLLRSGAQATAISGITQASSAVVTIIGSTYTLGQVVYFTGVGGMTQINGLYGTITGTGVNTITVNINTTTFSPYTSGGNAYLLAGTINYSTGAITITGGAPIEPLTGTSSGTIPAFSYYPLLPAMGLEDQDIVAQIFPNSVGFDTKYSYNILNAFPYPNYSVSYYKNPAANATLLPGYSPKTNNTPVTWNGANYQQFSSVNYQNALWAINGIQVPFSGSNIGMQFKKITNVVIVTTGPAPPASATLTIASHGLVDGDFVFVNEVVSTMPSANNNMGINFQTGYVTTVVNNNNVIVTFPFAILAGTYASGGIAQYLTSTAVPGVDPIRWYDGDPTNGSPLALQVNQPNGWVNFSPPLSQLNFPVTDLPPGQYYLVGAREIKNFKDRLVFFGIVVQTSTTGPFYLQDTIDWSQNGTPYYTTSFDNSKVGNAVFGTTVFSPTLTPLNQSSTAPSWFADVAGFGGWLPAGFAQPITSVAANRDVLIVGFTDRQTKLQYTGIDLNPFIFFIINSDLGTGSTFSSVVFDERVLAIGSHGITDTNERRAERIDLEIPDQVFEFVYTNNGLQRICSARNFTNEWVYFTYISNNEQQQSIFPDQTLIYNYRDLSWGIFYETYTTYGQFRKQTGFTWATVGFVYPTWSVWNDPWDASESTLLQADVIAGNQQGFVVVRDDGTGEAPSLAITAISSGNFSVPNHNLNNGDYIFISGALGTIGPFINYSATSPAPTIFSVNVVDANTITLNPPPNTSGTYLGLGVITKMYVPFIQTKQFQMSWGMGRKTRIGPQMYLFSSTANAQITLNIYLGQNAATTFNLPPIVPAPGSSNNALIYSNILYTCQESTNLGLTPTNINLQQITPEQQQYWHRMNTSLLGDTVQFGFTLSDLQMRDPTLMNQFAEIEFHGMVCDVTPSGMLS